VTTSSRSRRRGRCEARPSSRRSTRRSSSSSSSRGDPDLGDEPPGHPHDARLAAGRFRLPACKGRS
jgi:hypothetical protein